MDECIASSISQRTAYLMKTMSYLQTPGTDLKVSQPDYGTFSTFTDSRAFGESKSGSAAETCREGTRRNHQEHPGSGRDVKVVSRAPPMVTATICDGKPAASPATCSATNKFRTVDTTAGSKLLGSQNLGQLAPPLLDGNQLRLDMESRANYQVSKPKVPLYDTFYSPKCYQPVAMFNLNASQSTARSTGVGSALAARMYGLGSSWTYGKVQGGPTNSYYNLPPGCRHSTNCNIGLGGESKAQICDTDRLDNTAGKGSVYSNFGPQTGTGTGTSRTRNLAENAEHKVNSVSGKTKSLSGKPQKSAVPQERKSIRGQAQPSQSEQARKPHAGNPDHNNNFYKGGPGIFFCNRKKTTEEDEELTGPDRISLLARPKRYPCAHCFRQCCNTKRMTPEAMVRLEALAQPKLSHYTVCSCCQSPNCLGECTTRFKSSPSSCQSPSCVDWNRLAKPRKQSTPPFKAIKSVESRALTASGSRRINKLSIPRKVIVSGDYYLWLWKKKPDTIDYLKPIRRLSVSKCDLKDTRVLLRCDLDFTRGKPIDDKVRDVLPTMQLALKRGVKSIVIISRCGPEGIPKDPAYSLKPLAQVFEQYLETRVIFLDDCVGFQAQALCEDPVPGSVFLLENLSFNPEEIGYVMNGDEKIVCKKEDVKKYQKIVSDHGDIYITDSFTELVHMTNTTIGYPPKDFGYGFNIKKEMSIFYKFALKPPVPVLAIVAGPFNKTWTVVRNLMGKVADILVGGHVSSILMRVIRGIEIGQTECTSKMEKRALKLFSRAKDTQTTLHLPGDVVIQHVETNEFFVALTREDIDDWFKIVDIGPHTRKCFIKTIREAAAILWMGDFGPLSDGSEAIKAAYLEAASSGTPTYAADDNVKKFIGVTSSPEQCLFVTGDGEATENLLRGNIPKGISVLSRSRRKVKREPIPEEPSTKPTAYELPGMAIPGGTKAGQSYGASHSLMCINHIDVENMRVLIRVEFNEPMADSVISNNYRMRMTIPTIKYALKWRARAVIILAHFGEPRGKRDNDLTLKPICDEMATLLGETVIFVPRTVGKDVMTTINVVHPGSILMVENVRFHHEEEQGFISLPDGRLHPAEMLTNPPRHLPTGYAAEMNAQFCEELSRLGDIYVNDAFGALHLDHASVTGNFRPTRVCGFLVKNELKYLAKLLNYPARKFLVILGGVNFDDKMDALPGIFREADSLILAGKMACLFLKVEHGLKTGQMSFTKKHQERAKEMIKLAAYYKCRIHYPVDLTVSQGPIGEQLKQVSISEGIPNGFTFVDIGQLSASMFTRIIKRMHMIFWLGTTGNGQLDYERSSSKLLMEALQSVTHDPEKAAMTIVGGRGLSQIVEKYDPDHEAFTHLTTGGRTALELLAKRHVVGLNPLLPRPGQRPLSLMSCEDYTEFRETSVLLRCDLDLPMDDGVPLNVFPYQHLVDTIKMIQKKGAKAIILVSQRGHPDGQEIQWLGFEEIKTALETALDQPVLWSPGALTPDSESPTAGVDKGAVILTENVGFHPEEAGYMFTETGDRVPVSHEEINRFRAHLTKLADVFVNESFATINRAFSSVVGISRRPCIAGLGLKKQIYDYVDIRRQLDGAFLLIMGTEVLNEIFRNLLLLYHALDIVDNVFLCGNMAAVFQSAAASSNVKEFRDVQMVIPRILHKARLKKVTLGQVTDSYATKDPSNPDEEPRTVHMESSLPRGYTRCDMGPVSLTNLTSAIRASRLIVLCGTTGSVQYEHHQRGTKGILDQIANVTSDGSATAVALGMRTGQFIHHLGHVDTFNNYSVDPEPFFDIMVRRPLAGLQVLDRMPASLLKKLSMEQMDLSGKRVLMRLDLDVPSVEGVVLDTDKLEDAAPSIMYALNQGAKCVVILGHRGEPVGYKNYYLRMEPLVVEISAILGMDVHLIDRPCSKKAKRLLENPAPGSVYLMENLKFYPAEMGRDAEPRKFGSTRRPDDSSLTGVSEISKDEVPENSVREVLETEDTEHTDVIPEEEEEEEEESVSDYAMSVSDGEGGVSVDSLMYQLMRPKTVEQFIRDLAACGDVFINDDVAHVEEPLTSFGGFGLPERGCGLMLAEFLKDSEEASVYQLPGVDSLSQAP